MPCPKHLVCHVVLVLVIGQVTTTLMSESVRHQLCLPASHVQLRYLSITGDQAEQTGSDDSAHDFHDS